MGERRIGELVVHVAQRAASILIRFGEILLGFAGVALRVGEILLRVGDVFGGFADVVLLVGQFVGRIPGALRLLFDRGERVDQTGRADQPDTTDRAQRAGGTTGGTDDAE